MSPARLRAALEGHDVVVDLTRGIPVQMIAMTKNLIMAARRARVKKVIHISSIAIYGRIPGPDSHDESAAPTPDDDYGMAKLRQDELLLRSGMPTILLCPANIYGPYAPFILRAVQYLRTGQIALVDGGKTPANHVHVENVVEAILAAARCDGGCGERYFINEAEPISWREFYEDMSRILGLEAPLPIASRAEVVRAAETTQPRARFRDNFRVLLSGEFRKALSIVPLFRRANESLYNRFIQCSLEFQGRVRARLEKPTVIPKDRSGLDLGNRYITEQLRSVYHSPRKIVAALGYTHALTYRDGMETVRQWLEFARAA